jgi:membrane protein
MAQTRERANARDSRSPAAAPRDHEAERGRRARRPSDIPRRGLWDVLTRVRQQVAEDHLSIIAAGAAFYGFLAIFPGLAALVSIYGLITDPASLQKHMTGMQRLLPSEAAGVINSQLEQIGKGQESTLGWALVGGILIALWSASKGMKAMIEAMNIAYNEEEKRGFVKLTAASVLLTLGAILLIIFFLALIVGVPAVLANIQLGSAVESVISWSRWPLTAVCMILALAVLYRYAPSRKMPQWRWVSWGAVAAAVLWVAGSALFSLYVSNFGNYNATYGSLAAIVILITWLLLGAYSILLGAEINAELERQTAEDTTVEEPEPMGRRGAYAADTVGESSEEAKRQRATR